VKTHGDIVDVERTAEVIRIEGRISRREAAAHCARVQGERILDRDRRRLDREACCGSCQRRSKGEEERLRGNERMRRMQPTPSLHPPDSPVSA
jgi:hypothetical protein